MAWKPDYISVAQLKSFMRISHDDDDLILPAACAAISRAIDKHTNRQFGLVAAPEERIYPAWYNHDRGRWVVDVDDFFGTLTTLTIDGVTATEYVRHPRNAAAEGRPYTWLEFDRAASVVPCYPDYEVAATASWGWTAQPLAVTEAAYLQGNRFGVRRDSPYGTTGSADSGTELRLLAKLDPDVAVSLTDYVRPRRPR